MAKLGRGVVMPLQVRHVRDALAKEFSGLVPMADFQNKQPGERERAFLSRALAAFTLRRLADCSTAEAAAGIIDGRDDQGIDAILVDDSRPHLWLVQSKWSDQGTAGFDTGSAHKLIAGFRLIEQRKFERFNERFAPIADSVHEAMTKPTVAVTFVIALMGDGQLSRDVVHVLEDAKREFNGLGPVLDYQVVSARDYHRAIRQDGADPAISITVQMQRWLRRELPLDAYQGTVPVSVVNDWFAEHGDRLFEKNIRKSLGHTKVNQGVVETLCTAPENFWYFNNGITVLCDAVEPHYPGRRSPDAQVDLKLHGASIVNGAQTVAAIHDAMRQRPEIAAAADVAVRVICVAGGADGLDSQITEAANTQNRVEARDFAALRPEQALIRDDFRLSLNKIYVYKRGDTDPPPDSGCSVVDAAMALAHAHPNPEFAMRAWSTPDLLWDTSPRGAYVSLFGHSPEDAPGAIQTWRLVQLYRIAQSQLSRERQRRRGRAGAILDGGGFLAVHILFQAVGREGIDELDSDWEDCLDRAAQETSNALSWLIHHVDFEYGPSSFISKTFTNSDRCRDLVKLVVASLAAGGGAPKLPAEYAPAVEVRQRKPRRPNATAVLVGAGRIPEGATLTYRAMNAPEQAAVSQWVAADRKRGHATWINDPAKPLLWAYDGGQYSPSGLVMRIWQLAGWDKAPVAAQGPTRWHVPGEGNLSELATRLVDQSAVDDFDQLSLDDHGSAGG